MAKPVLEPQHVTMACQFFDQAAQQMGVPREAFGRLEQTLYIASGQAEMPERDPRQGNRIHMPGLAARPWHDPRDYDLAQLLQASYDDIKAELLALLEMDPEMPLHGQSEVLIKEGQWKEFTFYTGPTRNDGNAERCPRTAAVLDACPLKCALGGAKFSVLAPRTHVEPHSAPNNLRIRFHLGLIIPDGCEIRVKDEVRTWKEGEVLVLDDSFDHEVWNRGDQTRVILLVDSWHPDLTQIEVAALEKLVPYLQAAVVPVAA